MKPNAAVFLPALCLCCACSSQQFYTTAQGYRRNQCEHLPEQAERDRCMQSADASYDQYRRATAPDAKPGGN